MSTDRRRSPLWIGTEAGLYLISAIACSLYFQSFFVLWIGLAMALFAATLQAVINQWGDVRLFGRRR